MSKLSRSAKTPSPRTGLFAPLRGLLPAYGSGAPSLRLIGLPAVVAAALLGLSATPALAGTWTQYPTLLPKENHNAISCVSAKVCTAVGFYKGPQGKKLPLAEQSSESGSWLGAAQSAPVPSGVAEAFFNGISCTASNSCFAAGGTNVGSLIEFWNGKEWSIQSAPVDGRTLNSISCTSATACTAVGQKGSVTFAERWNGTEWTTQTTPNPEGFETSRLFGVSCFSTEFCIAVGWSKQGVTEQTLIEKWNGTEWSLQSSPNAENPSLLLGVSCTSTTACTAVGSGRTESAAHALVERWNGTEWKIQTNPSTEASLSGVSCSASASCTAVGSKYNGGTERIPYVEHWNGLTWSNQTAVIPPGSSWSSFTSISCVSSEACTAAGLYRLGATYESERPLVERYE